MAFCVNCGAPLQDEGAKFCAQCGYRVAGLSRGIEPENNASREEWAGKLSKCPNCGAPPPSFEDVCPSCGYELRGVKASHTVRELSKSLAKAKSHEEKETLIRSFPIPNTKEDVYEFFILATSNISSGGEGVSAWSAKLDQAYRKAELMFGDAPEFSRIKELYRKAKKGSVLASMGNAATKSKIFPGLILLAIGLLMVLLGALFEPLISLVGMSLVVWGMLLMALPYLKQLNEKEE